MHDKATRSPFTGVIVIIVGLAIAYLPQYIRTLLNGLTIGPEGPASTILWNWLAVALLVIYIVWIERRQLASILLTRPTQKDVEWAFYFWGIAMTFSWLVSIILPPPPNQGIETLVALPIPVLILLIFTAAITEEILYRGYPIERLRELTGNKWLAVLISFVIFILPHITFFGLQWLLYQGIGTIMIYILYVWRRNLWACILLHFLVNAPILIPALTQ
jgi:uncharacterized protein